MDQFLVLTTLADKIMTDRVCAALEERGIPVLLEHVELIEGNTSASGIRILVPSRYVTSAMRLLNIPSTSSKSSLGAHTI